MSKDALSYLYRIISRKDYTEFEIREKLYRKFGLESSIIEKLIGKLKEEGFIDDMRFAHNYVENKVLAGYGSLYIIAALSRKGININEEFIGNIISTMDIERIRENIKKILIKRHFLNIDKCYAFLQRRGFKIEEIKELVTEVNKDGSSVF